MKRFLTTIILFSIASCANNEGGPRMDNQDTNVVVYEHDTVFINVNDYYELQDPQHPNSEYFISNRLPLWFLKAQLLNELVIKDDYRIENRLNPLYLEEDFNGDGEIDIAIPIVNIHTKQRGFAIVHSKDNEVFIVGAGKVILNSTSDDYNYIDIWVINRSKINLPGVEEDTGTGKDGELILKNPSIEIIKDEVGGGQIYWNGKEYAYFHQTC